MEETTYTLEYDSGFSGCGETTFYADDLEMASDYAIDFVIENCEENDEMEGTLFNADTYETLGYVCGDNSSAQFDPA